MRACTQRERTKSTNAKTNFPSALLPAPREVAFRQQNKTKKRFWKIFAFFFSSDLCTNTILFPNSDSAFFFLFYLSEM